jgi:hypothetical protein
MLDDMAYSQLVTYYEDNKHKKWDEWLAFENMLSVSSGKQGHVGLFRIRNTDLVCMFKISQYIDYLIPHESTVMNDMSSIYNHCPYMCRFVGIISCFVNIKDSKNPFDITHIKYPMKKEVMLCEYISGSYKLYNLIRSKQVDDSVIYSAVKQILLALVIAQRERKFTHYDLHSCNILMRKCNPNIVFLFVIDGQTQFCVPSMGYHPVIIDFGFSYSTSVSSSPHWATASHTEAGITSDRFNWSYDPRLFLVSISSDIKYKRENRKSTRFRRTVRNMFGTLDIDWQSGWDNDDDVMSSTEIVADMIGGYNGMSELFDEHIYGCLDLIQSLIDLPLKPRDYSGTSRAYVAFLEEWAKIENEVSIPFSNMCILKGIVNAARTVKADYMSAETRSNSVSCFRKSVYNVIDKSVSFCRPKNIHFEKMLCSLLMLSDCIEGILFISGCENDAYAMKQNKSLPLQSIESIYAVIATNISIDYKYSKNTIVHVIDNINKEHTIADTSDIQMDNLNKIHTLTRGTELYKYLVENKK